MCLTLKCIMSWRHHLCCYLNENIKLNCGGCSTLKHSSLGSLWIKAGAALPAQEMHDPDVWWMDITSVGVVKVRRRSSRANRKSSTNSEIYWSHAKTETRRCERLWKLFLSQPRPELYNIYICEHGWEISTDLWLKVIGFECVSLGNRDMAN